VLLPAMQLDRLPDGIHAVPRGGLNLRGFPGDIEVLALQGELRDGEHRDASELWTRSPFNL
jgi:hypothetical protein